jgi:hypothetical protein
MHTWQPVEWPIKTTLRRPMERRYATRPEMSATSCARLEWPKPEKELAMRISKTE